MKKLIMLTAAVAVASGAWAKREVVGDYAWYYESNGDTAEVYGVYGFSSDFSMLSPATGAVTIPSTLGGKPVTSIGGGAFGSEITSVTIPDSVTRIGCRAFSLCDGLTSVTIPDSVTDIGEEAFSHSGLTSVIFGSGVKNIGNKAFEFCNKLSKVTIPDNVEHIGESAFSYSGLVRVTIANGVPNIGESAFEGCDDLTSVTIGEDVTNIGKHAFASCESLTDVTIGEGATNVGDGAFSGCTSLKNMELPDTIATIGDSAFEGCSSLEKLSFPASLTMIAPRVCVFCTSLKEVVVPENVTEIGKSAFTSTGVTNVDLRETRIVKIDNAAFAACEDLTKVLLPETLTYISDGAFFGLGSFKSPAIVVFCGEPPTCGENVFETEWWKYDIDTNDINEFRDRDSVSHSVFGIYCPRDGTKNSNAWKAVIDDWGRWNEVQMVMDVKPIACDYATENCGELNISWMAFPAYTNDYQKELWYEKNEYWYGRLEDLKGMDWDECYLQENWLVLSKMRYSIWRSSEDPEKPYDDFSCASNIAQHVGGVFSAANGFSATNFIDKTFGKFKGTKPVKYWIEIEDPDDPDNLRYLSADASRPSTRIRPIVEPDSCVTRRRCGLAVGVGAFDPNGKTASEHPVPEPMADIALFKDLYNRQYLGSSIGYDELINADATVKNVGDAFREIRYNNDGSLRARPGDILIMYMAMHGENGTLVLYDDKYTIEQLYKDMKILDESSGIKVIAILMACHSQSISDPAVSRDDKLDISQKFNNVAWITSCRANQVSTSIGDGLSLFGRCFLDFGWQQGCADTDKVLNLSNVNVPWNRMSLGGKQDGTLTFGELADYTFCLSVGMSSLLRSQVSITNAEILKNTVVWDNVTTENVMVPQEPGAFESVSVNGSVILRWRHSSDVKFYCVYYRAGNNDWEYRLVNALVDDDYRVGVKFDNDLNYKAGNGMIEKLNRAFVDLGHYLKWPFEDDHLTGSGIQYRPLWYGKSYEFKVVGVNQAGIGKCSSVRKENVLDFADLSRIGVLQYSGPVFLNSGERAGSLSASVRPVYNVVASAQVQTGLKVSANDDGVKVSIEVVYENGTTTSVFNGTGIILSNGVCNAILIGENCDMNVELTSYGIIAEFQGMVAYCMRESNSFLDEGEECLVTFNANGGIVSPANRTVEIGAAVGDLPTPTRSGYTFDGWFTAASGGTKITTATKVTANVTYYAHWTATGGGSGGGSEYKPGDPMPVKVVVDGKTETVTVTVGQPWGTKLPAAPAAPSGKTFAGWFTGPNGTGTRVTSSTMVGTVPVMLLPYFVEEESYCLYGSVYGAVPLAAASEYGGYLYDGNGAVAGTIQVKVGKANAKTGLAAVKATVIGLDGKKKSLKAAEKGKATISEDGPTTIKFVGGELCEVTLGAEGLSGSYGSYLIDGARNFFTSKDKEEQNAANGILAKWTGPVNVAWSGGTASVSIGKKGKAKVAIMLANGTKATANAQLLVGEERLCVPVVETKKTNVAFALWLPRDGGEVVVEGLPGGATAGRAGSPKTGAKFRVSKTAELWKQAGVLADYLPDGTPITLNMAKWTLPKAGKVAYLRGTTEIDASKLGENPSGLKLTYKAKDGSFKGSFKAYAAADGKLKKLTVNVTGVMIDGKGYGSASIKKLGGVAASIE